jgi:HSP20 family protein
MPAVKKTLRPPSIDLMLLQQEMNRLFERLTTLGRPERPAGGEWVPSVDVYECDGCLRVVVEVPGLQPDSLRVTYREGELTVSGERRDRRPSGVTGFLCMERPHGRFTRTVTLDVSLDVRQAQARLAGGVLTVVMPRVKDRRGRETVIDVVREQVSRTT